jgi:hypothetical protein
VKILDDFRVAAEHAVRTRFEMEEQNQLSATLDSTFFSFDRKCLITFNLQSCFDSLDSGFFTFGDNSFEQCNDPFNGKRPDTRVHVVYLICF